MDQLSYAYTGNQLQSVADAAHCYNDLGQLQKESYFLFLLLMRMVNPPPRTQIRGISKLLSTDEILKKDQIPT